MDENKFNSSEDIPFSSSSVSDASNNLEAVYFQLSADTLDNNQTGSPQAEEEEKEEEAAAAAEEEEEEGDGGDEEEEEESGNASPTPDV